MSWSERFVRIHKRQTDCAIHQAWRQLSADMPVLSKFEELLSLARKRAPRLLEAPVADGQHPGINALANLSRFQRVHIRGAVRWQGTTASWRPAVASLAEHLLCRYRMPAFLASCWYANDSSDDSRRFWFVEHARGIRFRSLNLPIAMTRKMEHIFLASPDHLSIDHAMRNAELTALGVPPAFATEILATSLAADLRHGKFWRTFWIFLADNADRLQPEQVGPMIDFIQAVRHERVTVETQDGTVKLDPPLPAFSMKGRTVQSMLRLVEVWHRSTLGVGSASMSWGRSPFRPLIFEEASPNNPDQSRRWQVTELTNGAQLRSEGAALHHCVATYAGRCRSGTSSIWSLRFWKGEKLHHILTIEVDPKRRAIIQARGLANRRASGKPLRLLQKWALRERLRIAI